MFPSEHERERGRENDWMITPRPFSFACFDMNYLNMNESTRRLLASIASDGWRSSCERIVAATAAVVTYKHLIQLVMIGVTAHTDTKTNRQRGNPHTNAHNGIAYVLQ